MDEFQSEKEQIEEIKQWWKEHRSFILTGIVLGVGSIGGFKYWLDFKERRASTASAYYEDLTQAIAQKDRNTATDLLDKFGTGFDATPYSSQAALAMAKFYVESSEAELAAEQLRSVLDNSRDDNLKLVARLRLARVQLSQDRAEEALATLEVVNPGSFAPRYHVVRGDVYAALGRDTDARVEYLSALAGFENGLFDRQLVEMKLNDLADADGDGEIASGMEPDTPSDPAFDTASDTASDSVPDATAPEAEPDA